MTLQSTIEGHVNSVFLNSNHFGTSMTHRPGVDNASVTGVFTEMEEVDSIRMGKLFTDDATTVLDGDLWLISGVLWRTLHTDVLEGMNTSMLHKQLPDSVSVVDRNWEKTTSGAQRESPGLGESMRAQIVKTSGDLEVDMQHRRIEAAYRIYFEESPELTNDKLLVNTRTGDQYRIIGWEDPEEFSSLFRAFCEVA